MKNKLPKHTPFVDSIFFKSELKCAIKEEIGKYPVVFENCPDDESGRMFLVCVYNVPNNLVEKFTDVILDVDWEMCRDTGYALVPMVTNEENTRKYYPQYLED